MTTRWRGRTPDHRWHVKCLAPKGDRWVQRQGPQPAGLLPAMEREQGVSGRTYPQGIPCWVDTEQPDIEAATQFYGGPFGWTFEDALPPGTSARYVIAQLDGQDVGAVAGPQEGAATWHTYISVDDANAAARRLVSVGATCDRRPPTRETAAVARY
jgi:predicted enzyme related to lactoylglutathione lyase